MSSLLSVLCVNIAVWRCRGRAPSAKAKSCILAAISESPSCCTQTTKNRPSLPLLTLVKDKGKSAHEPKAETARAYPGFISMKHLRVLLLPPGQDASPLQGYPTAVCRQYPFIHLASVVQTSHSAIHRIKHYPVDSVIDFHNTYPLDNDYFIQ